MTPVVNPQNPTREQIDTLQDDLVGLHGKVLVIRKRMEPLEEEMEHAYQEWIAAVHPLVVRANQLAGELARRRAPQRTEKPSGSDDPEGDSKEGTPTPDRPTPTASRLGTTPKPAGTDPGPRQSMEAVHKEQLLEFIFWVIDDQEDEADQMLFIHLEEMNDDGAVRLADMLEQIPEEKYRELMGDDEDDLPSWYGRLQVWRQALDRRLKELERTENRQRSGVKHDLWEQYQQGPPAWQSFLVNERNRLQQQIQRFEARLRSTN